MRRKTWFFLFVLLSVLIPGVAALPAEALSVKAPDRAFLGVPFPVEVFGDESLTGVDVQWMGRTLPMERSGTAGEPRFRTALVCSATGGKAGRQILTFVVTLEDRVLKLPWQVSVEDRSFPVNRLTVAPAKAVPPPEVLKRIARERREAAEVLDAESFPVNWDLPLVRPVKGIVTSSYGARRTFNGTTHSRHSGIDFRASPGTPVRAVADGTVVLTGDRYFSGRSVFVDHGGGLVSLYGHLSEISVRPGQRVCGGGIVGLSGATGRVTGPHLHFGLGVHGQMADAMSLFDVDRQAFESDCREIAVE